MKTHLNKYWGWYLILLLQAVLVGYKATGFFPQVTWFGIFIPVVASLFLITVTVLYQWKDTLNENNRKK